MRPPRNPPELHLVDAERFWSCVDIAGQKDCWPWVCARNTAGHGTIFVAGRTVAARRVAWALHHGRTPDQDFVVASLCDNPPCVNPLHLVARSRNEHNRDIATRRRRQSFDSVAVARALVDGATVRDLVDIFGMPAETAAEYVALGPAGAVGRRAARGVRIPQKHTRRRLVANETALAAARDGATVGELVDQYGLSRATAYRYLLRTRRNQAS